MKIPGAGQWPYTWLQAQGRPLSSSLLYTFESLIGKAMSLGCECVTRTGVEVASAGKNEGLGGQQQGWRTESPAWEEGHKEGALS